MHPVPTWSDPQRDNLFGICAALGADFGFDPLWLRIALGAGILWNPLAVFATYAALGLVVLAARLAFPDRRRPAAAPAEAAAPANDDAALARAA